MPHPKQPAHIVQRQMRDAEQRLAAKRAALVQMTSQPHITRCQLEIAELERRIAEYKQHLGN
jgi:hypothetical protein